MRTRMVCKECNAPVLGTNYNRSLEWVHLSSLAAATCDPNQDFCVQVVEIRICDVRICERAADVLTRDGTRAECSGHAYARQLAEEKWSRNMRQANYPHVKGQRQTVEGRQEIEEDAAMRIRAARVEKQLSLYERIK